MGNSTKNKTTFATIVFNQSMVDVEPVVLFQYNQGLGVGKTLNCKICLMNVDDVLSNPTYHRQQCVGAVIE